MASKKISDSFFRFLSVVVIAVPFSATVCWAAKLQKPGTAPVAVVPAPVATERDLSQDKPALDKILKPRSLQKIVEDLDVVTNAGWEEQDFEFVNAVVVRAPLRFARKRMLDFSLYKQMSSAIHEFNYDPKTNLIEVKGEAGGLYMHSWIRPDLHLWDEFAYEFVAGDLKGFKVKVYLWDKEGRTITVAKGLLPSGKKMFPQLLTVAFPTLAEIVLGIATKNFRKFIEDDYNKQKGSH